MIAPYLVRCFGRHSAWPEANLSVYEKASSPRPAGTPAAVVAGNLDHGFTLRSVMGSHKNLLLARYWASVIHVRLIGTPAKEIVGSWSRSATGG